MISQYRSAVCIFGKYMQNNLPLMLSPINFPCDNSQQVRTIKKHWNPKFKKERREKFIKVELLNFDESEDMSKERIRSEMKKYGLIPQRIWNERPNFVSCTPNIFESYVVPEGDGKFSTITKEGAKQKFEFIEKKGKSMLAINKIKSYEDNFSTKLFTEQAMDIYKKAHEALAAKDEEKLIQYVTETAFPQMMHNMTDKTIHWQFLESLEPARLVHARCTSVLTKENLFAQITIRFHTQQILCIYDRFGRVVMGSEILRKDVLDYVVFEKHLSNEYGVWRIHGKIVPSWMPPEEVPSKTYTLRKQEDDLTEKPVESVAETVPPEMLGEQSTQDTSAATR
ncbi:probable 39S ribosomal protein L45, mitochondrial [Hylaeus anthracinus]|uniref:probable 39S ribosomal protein L45, mitochondrial n=1 Tax=Hylaeus anthracinus TaxID=313031 RepID=UPI0023B8FA10|nr:probable 39S ribosomal protein L45, mitochondrial [Hylaeus anthracinus]